MYTLEGNCVKKHLINNIMLISAIFYGLLALKYVFFILWRIYLRRIEKKGYTSLDYMLVYALLFNICK
jgi:hypothetical protein